MQLFGNVRRIKYRLKIHPIYLKFSPFFQNIRNSFQIVEPFHNSLFKRLFEGGEEHSLSCCNMVVHKSNCIVIALNNPTCFEHCEFEIYILPSFNHLIEVIFNIPLFGCLLRYLNTSFHMLQ